MHAKQPNLCGFLVHESVMELWEDERRELSMQLILRIHYEEYLMLWVEKMVWC